MKPFSPDKRNFLKLGAAATGTSLVLAINWACSPAPPGESTDNPGSFRPNAWIRLEPDGLVTIFVAESEMGQGTYTSIPMMVAEELEVDWDQIRVEHAPLDPAYGYQSTGGSTSIRKGWRRLREAGAIARELMLRAGAEVLSVNINECKARHGRVIHSSSGRKLPYYKLIPVAASLPIPKIAYLKEAGEFTIIGTPVARGNITEIISGAAQYGIDLRLPGMLHATTIHCPVLGGSPVSIDASRARKIKNLVDIFEINEGVAVVATDTWSAFKARDALVIDWDIGDTKHLSTESMIHQLKQLPLDEGNVAWHTGNLKSAIQDSQSTIAAEYIQPMQAHVPGEPINCTAWFRNNGKLEIWAPTQSPSSAYSTARLKTQNRIERGLRKALQYLFGSQDKSINVHTTLLGGGFGRRLKQDYVSEAVQIAQNFDKPVQLVWTREEDIQHDFYHPLTLHRMRGAIDKSGLPVAWEHTIGGAEITSDGAAPPIYSFANMRVNLQDTGAVYPRGPWRSVALHYNVFAVEHFLDELAHAGGQDPLDLRIRLLSDHPRLQKLLEIAAEKTDWGNQNDTTISKGVAVISNWGSYVAQIVEVSPSNNNGGLRINKVTCIIDCGIVINPDHVKQQMEGSIIYGLTAATKSRITLSHGRVDQSNFHDYPILRIDETPEIEVIIVKNKHNPGGVGEPGVPPLAPALANSILAATGKPVREFPIKLAQ